MLSCHYTKDLLNLQGVNIIKIKHFESNILIYTQLPVKSHICPCCKQETSYIHDYRKRQIKDISALNIRIAHEILHSSEIIAPLAEKGGILIIGPPCSGKTTILRDASRKYSDKYHTVIVDERCEIAGICRGEASFNIGNSAVLNGFYKKDGIEFAVRSMAPDIIICDEFGDENDICSALFAMKSGTKIIASAHAFDKKDFLDKPFSKNIILGGIFSYFVFLGKNFEINEIVSAKEIFL